MKYKENRSGLKTRADLLEAAGKIFAEKGYDTASVRDIARCAGVLPGAITYHFKSKRNLFKKTLEYFILEDAQLGALFNPFNYADSSKPETLSKAMYESVRNLIYISIKTASG